MLRPWSSPSWSLPHPLHAAHPFETTCLIAASYAVLCHAVLRAGVVPNAKFMASATGETTPPFLLLLVFG